MKIWLHPFLTYSKMLIQKKKTEKKNGITSTFSTSAALLAFIYTYWIQSPELKSCSGRGMLLPFHGSFIHCVQANS